MKFVTIFERAEYVHLKKDVGQIPIFLKNNYGFDSELWTFKDIAINDTDINVIKINSKWTKIKFSPKLALNIIIRAKKIDVLNVYHYRLYSLIYANLYKTFNKRGFVYMKGDFDVDNFKCKKKNLLDKLLLMLAKKVDLVSYEHKLIEGDISKIFRNSAKIFIPNSPAIELMAERRNFSQLKNRNEKIKILIIGRIGVYQKNTEEAFEILKKLNNQCQNWEALVVGEISDEFRQKIDNKYKHESFFNNVTLSGSVSDAKQLASIYQKSDILLMTSRYEGFPLVAVEAGYFGLCILANKTSGVNELIDHDMNGYFYLSTNDAANFLQKLSLDETYLTKLKSAIKEKVERYSWEQTLPSVVSEIENRIGNV